MAAIKWSPLKMVTFVARAVKQRNPVWKKKMMVTFSQAVVAYTFNPTQHSGDGLCESKAILAYRVVPGQPGQHRETRAPKIKAKKKK